MTFILWPLTAQRRWQKTKDGSGEDGEEDASGEGEVPAFLWNDHPDRGVFAETFKCSMCVTKWGPSNLLVTLEDEICILVFVNKFAVIKIQGNV